MTTLFDNKQSIEIIKYSGEMFDYIENILNYHASYYTLKRTLIIVGEMMKKFYYNKTYNF